MNRYSKIKLGYTNKSRSKDFSDLESFPDNYTKPIEPMSQKSTHNKIQEAQQIKNSNTHNDSPSDVEEEHGQHDVNINSDGTVSKFVLPMLIRNGSVSSTTSSASKRFKLGKQQSSSPRTTTATTKETVQSVVKRAFSMRRSSSASERYCRIHDQCVSVSSPFNDMVMMTERMMQCRQQDLWRRSRRRVC